MTRPRRRIMSQVRWASGTADTLASPDVTCNILGMTTPEPASVRARVRSHRDRLRAQGLRPIQIWVPDVRARGFADEAHRQSAAVAASSHATDDQGFIDAISSDDD